MNAKDMLIEWLQAHGCDGLCNIPNDNCGCGIDDLAPGFGCLDIYDCIAARKCEPDDEQKADGCTVAYAPADLSPDEGQILINWLKEQG